MGAGRRPALPINHNLETEMNASKEQCRIAMDGAGKVEQSVINVYGSLTCRGYFAQLREFLEAAHRKLPSEAAYQNERKQAS